MEHNLGKGVDVPQVVEANKARMREQIRAASESFPVTRLVLANQTLRSGLNLKDYYDVQRLFRPSWSNFETIQYNKLSRAERRTGVSNATLEDYYKEDITKHHGDVSIGEQRIKTIGELRTRFIESRRDLVEIFSKPEFSHVLKLGDIIMIDRMMRHELLEGNLRPQDLRRRRCIYDS